MFPQLKQQSTMARPTGLKYTTKPFVDYEDDGQCQYVLATFQRTFTTPWIVSVH